MFTASPLVTPEVALLLAALAVLGLLLEIAVPGVGMGAVLALFLGGAAVWGLAGQDVAVVGITLLIVATVVIVAGVFIRRWGALVISGGLLWMLAGGTLFDDTIAWQAVLASAAVLVGAGLLLGRLVGRTGGAAPWSGQAGSLQGQRGEVRQGGAAGQRVQVLVAGALWSAKADTALQRGARVEVIGQQGLQLRVCAVNDDEGQGHGEN